MYDIFQWLGDDWQFYGSVRKAEDLPLVLRCLEASGFDFCVGGW